MAGDYGFFVSRIMDRKKTEKEKKSCQESTKSFWSGTSEKTRK